MSTFGIVVYILWLVFLFLLPALVFARFLMLPENLARLEGLVVTPYFDQEKNVTRVNTNYDEFAAAVYAGANSVSEKNFFAGIIQKLKLPGKLNIPLAILRVMCGDARNGVSHHPDLYLACYKNSIRRFTGYVTLGSFMPALVLLLKPNPENAFPVGILQAGSLILVFILYQVLRYMFEAFEAVFYKKWFDGILNFDCLALQQLRPHVLDSLAPVFQQDMWKNLNEGNIALAGQLEKFYRFREEGNELSGEDIVETTQSKIAGLEELRTSLEKMENICKQTNNSFENVRSVVSRHSNNMDVITQNTRSLIELKNVLSKGQESPEGQESPMKKVLDMLQNVTKKLDDSIGQSFKNIEDMIKINADGLSASFEEFSKVCHRLTVLPTLDDEQTLIKDLQDLNKHLSDATRQVGANSEA
jgi:hypothetical protein